MMSVVTTNADRASELAAWPWHGESERQAGAEGRERAQPLYWGLVSYWVTLLVCCSLFGLFAGGCVGFIEAATPAVDEPGSFTQLASSDVGWATMARQYRAASHRISDPAAGSDREASWRLMTEGTPVDKGSTTLNAVVDLKSGFCNVTP
jgi:hypothetical protein